MGTPANTVLYQDEEFILTHTRWDGIPSDIKAQAHNIHAQWSALALFATRTLATLPAERFPELRTWVTQLQQTLNEPMSLPLAASLFCGQSWVHHRVRHALTEDTLGEHEELPDVALRVGTEISPGSLRNAGITARKLDRLPPKVVPLDDLVRITTRTKDDDTYHDFVQDLFVTDTASETVIDVRCVGIKPSDIGTYLAELPVFLCELHCVLGLAFAQAIHEKPNEAQMRRTLLHRICVYSHRYFKTLFDSYYHGRSTHAEILEEVSCSIPFDMQPTSLASLLFLASGGRIRPLTHAEQLYTISQEIPTQVQLLESKVRTSDLYCSPQSLHTHVAANTERWYRLAQHLGVNSSFVPAGTSPYVLREPKCGSDEKPQTGINLEETMILMYDILTEYFLAHPHLQALRF